MKHIFVVHSNICCIVIRSYILKLIGAGEQVIVITYRGQKWPFDKRNIRIIDFSTLFQKYYVYHVSSIKEYFRRLIYQYKMKKFINQLVKGQEYILYIPNYAVDYQTYLAENRWCRGYYFIEEGTLAYTPIDYLKRKEQKKDLIQRFKNFAGISNHFFLETTNKFKGTIAITNEAFRWNNKDRKVVKPIIDVDKDYKVHKNIIVTGYFSSSMSSVKDQMNTLLTFIGQSDETDIAIKFHPHLYYNFPKKIDEISAFIKTFNNVKVDILPADYIVEKSIFAGNCNIYSLDKFSSLNIYSVLFGGHSYTLTDKAVEFHDLNSCIKFVTSN